MRLLEVHIGTSDLNRAVSFYSQLFPAAKVSWWRDRSAASFVFDSGTMFGLWEPDRIGLHGGRAGAHVHFAIQIELDEVETFRQRLCAMGVAFIEHDWKAPHKSLYFFDPDGHQGELMTIDWNDFLKE